MISFMWNQLFQTHEILLILHYELKVHSMLLQGWHKKPNPKNPIQKTHKKSTVKNPA